MTADCARAPGDPVRRHATTMSMPRYACKTDPWYEWRTDSRLPSVIKIVHAIFHARVSAALHAKAFVEFEPAFVATLYSPCRR